MVMTEIEQLETPIIRWHTRRRLIVRDVLLGVQNLQVFYGDCVSEALIECKKRTGVRILMEKLNLRDGDRKYLTDLLLELGVVLHSRDSRGITWSKKFDSKPVEERQSIVQSRKEGLVSYWKSADEKVKEDRGLFISQAKAKYLATYSPEELEQRYDNMSWFTRLSVDQQNLIKERISASWQTLTDEERLTRSENIYKGQVASGNFGGSHPFVTNVRGKDIRFHSSWEYSMYNLLFDLNIDFKYANEHGTKLRVVGKTWNPDFMIESKSTLIEVKGFYLAYEKFFDIDLPAFLASEFSQKYNLYLCEFDVSYHHNFSTYEDLLQACTEIHRV
jgi:hypothetical protein